MSTERLYSIAEAAALVNISPSTVRNWTGQFATHFSSHATPSPGTERLLTGSDVAIMQTIAELRQLHVGFAEIAKQLDAQDTADLTPYVVVEPVEPATESQNEVGTALAIVNAIDNRYEALERRLREFEATTASKQTWFVVGVCVGLIVGLIAALLFGLA